MRSIHLGALSLTALSLAIAHGQAVAQHWSLYALGGYSVAMPSAPQQLAEANLPTGFRSWSANVGAVPYVVTITEIKGEDQKQPADAILSQCIAGVLDAGKGTITAERDVLFEGWPGVEVRYKQEPGRIGVIRAFVVKNQLVNLIVSHTEGSLEPEGQSKFFNSFKLPSDIQKGALTEPGPPMETVDLESTGFTCRAPRGAKMGTTPIGTGPATVQMHRFASAYLNRVYMGVVIDPPSGAKRDLDSDTTGKPAQAVNASLASLLGATISKTDSRTTALGSEWGGSFTLGHGLVGRLETYIRNNHTYSLLAIVPEAMLTSDEVKGFFASVTLPERKS